MSNIHFELFKFMNEHGRNQNTHETDREKVIKGLECCTDGFMMCKRERCPYYGKAPIDSTCRIELEKDALALLKEQEKETDRILKVVRDVIYSGVSTDTEPDQDYVYELIRNGVQQSLPTVVTDINVPDKWISVKDRLPSEHDSLFANHPHFSKHMWAKESDDVIVYAVFPDGTGRATEGRLRDGKWNTKISPILEPVITHWMPLPELPKGDKQND